MSARPRHSVSVAAAIVRDDGQVLLAQRRDNGHWEPPGGVLEEGETIADGLAREVAEETGLTVEVDTLTGIYQNLTVGVVALVFRARPVAGALATSSETSSFRWVPAGDIDALMEPVYAVRIHDAYRYVDRPAVRSHDGSHVNA